ncbi:cytochrome P450 [Paenibacillus mucilaginosus]|uniref:Cyp109 n=1 Tax=Paenibacillus mucilaginosus (strain KNP414) TaxID=1036673 RepID=F8FI55_PAEMK|nr:cytochrome P450 [Paenibacillus mucilaginosus]AEI43958.1 Cyp109 [Paenibacillus mucilaginosus KNP414]MCG7212545.1 cytochrome P450 [Paenibacillus mucilaginosus]WDM25426.1 cytochrome P450 [Paenibacillus mucilaginosus]
MNTGSPAKYANIIPLKELDTVQKQLYPFDFYREARTQTPVRYNEHRSAWDLFLYADVHRVLKDPAAFSSRRGMEMRTENLLVMDPPRHTQMRDLVNKAFTPKAIGALEEHIRRVTADLLDEAAGRGSMEMVHDLAAPLPVIIIAELLGVPTQDRKLFKEWSDVLVKGVDENTEAAFAKMHAERGQAAKELSLYFSTILKERRTQPQDDLISALLAAEIDGKKLSEEEVISFAILLLVAGNETTTNLITNGVRRLTEDPALQTLLQEQPELVPGFVEEVLRFYPPILAVGRVAAQDVEIGGQTIRAGDQVISWVASANRDERKFDDADAFRPDRKPNPHLAFGFGPHFCLGAPLARLEAKVAAEELLRRFRDLRLEDGAELVPIPSPFVFGVKSYPVTFRTQA